MAKYGEFEYGAMAYGKTVLVGEGVISPEGKVLSKIKVFVVNVGKAIVSPVTSFVRNIAVSVTVGMAGTETSKYATFKYGERPYAVDAHRPTSSLSRSIDIHRNVGMAGTVTSKYATFKYGEKPYAVDAQRPTSSLPRSIDIHRNVGEGIVSPVARAAKMLFQKVGDGAVSIVGTLSSLLYAWLRGDIIGRLRKRDDLKGRIKR